VTFIVGAAAALLPLTFAFLLAAVLSLALTPVIRRFAVTLRMVDRPGHRRVNTRPIPRAGGLAVAISFLGVAVFLTLANDLLDLVSTPALLNGGQLIALFAGGAAAAGIGVLDDYLDLRARWQLAAQVALAAGAVALGIGIFGVQNPFGRGSIVFETPIAAALAMLWIVGMMNSVNFIDGLDGLSSGIGLIAAVTLGTLGLTTQVGQPYIALLCFALAGALAGFLRWNFHPARIFAGTGGTMFLGYTLAVLAILGSAKVAVALLVLGIPIIDTFWIIVRRVAGRRSPFAPDRGHIHHRLLDLGLSHRQTVILIYVICISLGALSLVLSAASQVYAFLGVLVASGVVLFAMTRGGIAAEALEAGSYEDAVRDPEASLR
jgi:UDP-GlcNAc:undecaprenyl-phosphate/decaprenyl-phosphate GlcNAc-1-phosphate transferase